MKMLKKTFYHGTDKKLITLKPVGINMGSRFSNPKWSIYFWKDEKLAELWAIYQTCRRNTKIKTIYHIQSGKFVIKNTDLNTLKREIRGLKAYVYSKEFPITQMGLGSSPDIDEFTYDKEVVPDSVKEIKITDIILNESIVIMSEAEFNKYKEEVIAGKYSGGRGLFYQLIMDSEKDRLRHQYKDLEPGSEIPASMKW